VLEGDVGGRRGQRAGLVGHCISLSSIFGMGCH
jgi:hypothetical protein